ncbi:class I SAM-dependent methyltransferase [Nocardioides houyundeii]|uniref:class I SAM-dependent methyltransferase n=1 Tax=Nocardioides houyundeii TaxID=2045452 RepID=UPI0018EFBACB|nr:class I SAM-dependent methyltransferase [Nocardioides houyundeii]
MPSPNIWQHPETYELENRALDPDELLESAMAAVAPWRGRTFLDVGCGTGFHLPRWAEEAERVIGVEPMPALAALAGRRTRRLAGVEVRQGTAQALPLPEASVDVAQARLAYFFGPGCEPGLDELSRVVRRGGTAFVIDNDPTRSTFGHWFRRGYPRVDPVAVERFWSTRGWQRVPVETRLAFDSPADLEAVVRIELDRQTADAVLAEHWAGGGGTEVDYALNLWWRRF